MRQCSMRAASSSRGQQSQQTLREGRNSSRSASPPRWPPHSPSLAMTYRITRMQMRRRKRPLMCVCGYFMFDAHGNHWHTCTQHKSTTQDAHEHILSSVRNIYKQCDLTSIRMHVASSRWRTRKLEIRVINLAGKRNIAIDVALVHYFSDNCWCDVSRNGQLHYDDPDVLPSSDGKNNGHMCNNSMHHMSLVPVTVIQSCVLVWYSSIPGHRNLQIETAVWIWPISSYVV